MSTRRQLLAATGVLVAGSGCAGGLGDDDSTAEASATPGAVRLEELSVRNNHEEGHRVHLAVEADGEVLHLETYDLAASAAATVEGDWNEAAASYRVHARLDDGAIRTADVTEGIGEGADCVRVLVRIDDADGRLEVWNSADCASESGGGAGTGTETET